MSLRLLPAIVASCVMGLGCGGRGKQGPAGPSGAPGAAGTRGEAGAVGPVGSEGATGPQGEAGDPGPQGPIGLTGAVGPAGPAGDIGPAGAIGPAGPQGAAGDAGPTGALGPAGAIGPAGPPGPAGPAGPPGDVGSIGPSGLPGAMGSTGPAGPTGPTGDVGPAGPPGERGPAGAAGLEGATGPKGDIGLTGAKGDPGPKGDIGLTGAKGDVGARGADGDPGEDGLSCWDLDGDGVGSAAEDINGDGHLDAADCGAQSVSSRSEAVFFDDFFAGFDPRIWTSTVSGGTISGAGNYLGFLYFEAYSAASELLLRNHIPSGANLFGVSQGSAELAFRGWSLPATSQLDIGLIYNSVFVAGVRMQGGTWYATCRDPEGTTPEVTAVIAAPSSSQARIRITLSTAKVVAIDVDGVRVATLSGCGDSFNADGSGVRLRSPTGAYSFVVLDYFQWRHAR